MEVEEIYSTLNVDSINPSASMIKAMIKHSEPSNQDKSPTNVGYVFIYLISSVFLTIIEAS